MMKSAAALVAVTAVLLSGCASTAPEAAAPSPSPTPADNGIAALSALVILDRAEQALKNAKSFHLSGNFRDETGDVVRVDLKRAGADLLGSMDGGEIKFEVLTVDGQGYVRFNEGMLASVLGEEAAANAAPLLTKQWITSATGDASFTKLLSAFDTDEIMSTDGEFTKGRTTTLNGHPAVILSSADGDLYVATTGEPYPLKMSQPGGGSLLLTEIGGDFPEIKQPEPREVTQMPSTTKTTKA